MLAPTGRHINPLGLAHGLAGSAEALGMQIFEQSPALSYAHDGAKWIVKIARG